MSPINSGRERILKRHRSSRFHAGANGSARLASISAVPAQNGTGCAQNYLYIHPE
jgi:hypothetical protein